MDLNNLVKGLLGELQRIAKSDSIVGKPMQLGAAHLVPLSRITVGFGTGTSDVQGTGGRRDGRGQFEAGGAGGGIMVEPRAFVVVGPDGVPQLLTMRGGNATVQQAVELPKSAGESDSSSGLVKA